MFVCLGVVTLKHNTTQHQHIKHRKLETILPVTLGLIQTNSPFYPLVTPICCYEKETRTSKYRLDSDCCTTPVQQPRDDTYLHCYCACKNKLVRQVYSSCWNNENIFFLILLEFLLTCFDETFGGDKFRRDSLNTETAVNLLHFSKQQQKKYFKAAHMMLKCHSLMPVHSSIHWNLSQNKTQFPNMPLIFTLKSFTQISNKFSAQISTGKINRPVPNQ